MNRRKLLNITVRVMVSLLLLLGGCAQKIVSPPKVMQATVRLYFDTEKTEDWAEYPGEFIPDIVVADKGATVTWVNRDIKEHTIVSDNGVFTQSIQPGANFSYTFNDTGNYSYYCELYRYCYPYDMLGRIIVE